MLAWVTAVLAFAAAAPAAAEIPGGTRSGELFAQSETAAPVGEFPAQAVFAASFTLNRHRITLDASTLERSFSDLTKLRLATTTDPSGRFRFVCVNLGGKGRPGEAVLWLIHDTADPRAVAPDASPITALIYETVPAPRPACPATLVGYQVDGVVPALYRLGTTMRALPGTGQSAPEDGHAFFEQALDHPSAPLTPRRQRVGLRYEGGKLTALMIRHFPPN